MDDYTRKFDFVIDQDAEIHRIMLTVYQALEEKGYNVVFTRTGDEYMDLYDRCDIANAVLLLIVRIHKLHQLLMAGHESGLQQGGGHIGLPQDHIVVGQKPPVHGVRGIHSPSIRNVLPRVWPGGSKPIWPPCPQKHADPIQNQTDRRIPLLSVFMESAASTTLCWIKPASRAPSVLSG